MNNRIDRRATAFEVLQRPIASAAALATRLYGGNDALAFLLLRGLEADGLIEVRPKNGGTIGWAASMAGWIWVAIEQDVRAQGLDKIAWDFESRVLLNPATEAFGRNQLYNAALFLVKRDFLVWTGDLDVPMKPSPYSPLTQVSDKRFMEVSKRWG